MEQLKQRTVEYCYLDTKIFNFTANVYQLQILSPFCTTASLLCVCVCGEEKRLQQSDNKLH